MEHDVGRMRAAHVIAFLAQPLDRRHDDVDLLAAERAVLAGMRVEAGDGDARLRRCRTGAAARATAARPLATIRSTVSRPGTSRSGTWVVTGTTRSVGPASIIATRSLGDAAALGDELGLAGMDEADRVELRLRHRPGDEAGGGARPGEPDRELERVERVARAVQLGLAGRDARRSGHLDDRQARFRTGRRPRLGSPIPATGPSQTASIAATLPTAKKGGTGRSSAVAPSSSRSPQAPMPAGSPSATASGVSGRSAIVDHRVAPQDRADSAARGGSPAPR